jgi:hypothetical protein
MPIQTVPAKDLRKGDVFSTDGGVVTSVVSLEGGGAPDEIAVQVICHGIEKFTYLSPNHPCPLWKEEGK